MIITAGSWLSDVMVVAEPASCTTSQVRALTNPLLFISCLYSTISLYYSVHQLSAQVNSLWRGKIMKKGYRIKNKRRLKHMPHKSILITYAECRWLYHSTKMTIEDSSGTDGQQIRSWWSLCSRGLLFHYILTSREIVKKQATKAVGTLLERKSKWNININYHRYKDYCTSKYYLRWYISVGL